MSKSDYFAARRKQNREAVNAIKVASGCADCGFDAHPAALEFDHMPGCEKHRDVGRMVSIGAGMNSILVEIAKCEVVCANCHAIRTAERRESETI